MRYTSRRSHFDRNSSRSSWSHSTALHARLGRTHIRVCQSTATVSCLEHRRQQIYRKGFVRFLRGKTLAALDMVCYSCACVARPPAWTSMHAHQAALLGRHMPSYPTLVPPPLPASFSQRQRSSHSCRQHKTFKVRQRRYSRQPSLPGLRHSHRQPTGKRLKQVNLACMKMVC